MSKSVTLDGQIIHGVDRLGSWRINSVEGWDETPEAKSNSESRPLADGDYDSEVFYGSRLVTLNGRLSAKTPGDAFMARERLTALLGSPGRFQVDQFGLVRWGTARRGKIKPGQIKGRHLPFQMELRFIDPRKFGKARSFSTAVGSPVDVLQRGSFPATPIVTVTGSMPSGYDLSLNGRLVSITKSLASGSTHTIDMRTGILRQNGTVVAGGFSYSELLKVEPGMPQNFFASTASGSGTVRLDYYDTYI
ncbi:hypothetical protein [Glutamicibacter sp.]|uniref:hypothetical protein n=1 Tax=Glutamicibacter sp. TaxID=1931995 RepID=UPI002FE0EA52